MPDSSLLWTGHSGRPTPRQQRRSPAALAEGDANPMSSGDLHAVVADTVFDGTKRHEHAGVLIDGARVSRIVPRDEIPRNPPARVLPDGIWLAPGFIDLQVNGGGDMLFNDSPTPEAISVIAAAHRKFGTTG